jgi:hypothetical protein
MSAILFGIAIVAALAAVGGSLSLSDVVLFDDLRLNGVIPKHIAKITAFVVIALVAGLLADGASAIAIVLSIIGAVIVGFAASIYIERTAAKPLLFKTDGF